MNPALCWFTVEDAAFGDYIASGKTVLVTYTCYPRPDAGANARVFALFTEADDRLD